jgi:hypothetical protein
VTALFVLSVLVVPELMRRARRRLESAHGHA